MLFCFLSVTVYCISVVMKNSMNEFTPYFSSSTLDSSLAFLSGKWTTNWLLTLRFLKSYHLPKSLLTICIIGISEPWFSPKMPHMYILKHPYKNLRCPCLKNSLSYNRLELENIWSLKHSSSHLLLLWLHKKKMS